MDLDAQGLAVHTALLPAASPTDTAPVSLATEEPCVIKVTTTYAD